MYADASHLETESPVGRKLEGFRDDATRCESSAGDIERHGLAKRLEISTMASISQTDQTAAVIERFNDAFNRHDVDAVMAAMTDDCIFENTSPAPDGTRYEGAAAVRGFWERFFRGSPHAHFEAEDQTFAGDRAVVAWVYTWRDESGTVGHIRGVDLFRVRDGKVAEKLSYVKG
jgi:ketosteroid isomerase-like protein